MRTSSTLWIIHRDVQPRGALARIAEAGEDTILGAPGDELFESASPADVVLLAPSGDYESELEFVHRFGPRMPKCAWVLLPEAGDLTEALRLFDNLPASFVRFPPAPDQLRRTIHEALHRRSADSLSRRRGRDRLTARFSRWFGGLELPDLLRALDPALSHLPLLIRGEDGTGRGLIARYIHAFGSSDDAALRQIPCRGVERPDELLAFIDHLGTPTQEWRRTLWLEDVHLLPASLQSMVRDWIDYGLPDGSLRASNVRWIASADDAPLFDDEWARIQGRVAPHLGQDLADALSGLFLRLPSLRERQQSIEPFVADTAVAWANAQGQRMRHFSADAIEELCSHPWPGNMEELENVVQRSLALSGADPLEPHHLRFHGHSPWGAPGTGDAQGRGASHQPLASAEIATELPEPSAGHRVGPPLYPLPAFEVTNEDDFEGEIEAATEISAMDDEPPAAIIPPTAHPDPIPSRPPSTPAAIERPPVARHEARDEQELQQLVGALAHEVRNPLVSIRTFSELLPDNYDDQEFRSRFAELVGADVRRIEGVVDKLQELASLEPSRREPIDIAALLDRLLDAEREAIEERSLLVLKELDRTRPYVIGDPEQLENAFTGLVRKAISLVPERGDVYLASKHHTSGLAGDPAVRVLIRYHNPNAPRPRPRDLEEGIRIEGITPAETSLDFLVAQAVMRAQGGVLTLDTTDSQETVIVVDLPAPLET